MRRILTAALLLAFGLLPASAQSTAPTVSPALDGIFAAFKTHSLVGLVYIAAMREGGTAVVERHLFGDIGREQVRLATVEAALTLLKSLI